MQLVYSPHKLQKFFLSLKNIYLILVCYSVLNVARHQSFISEETEKESIMPVQCIIIRYWEPPGNLAIVGTTKGSDQIVHASITLLAATRVKI